jgi:U3 small nucleolar RNA-associated protein 12
VTSKYALCSTFVPGDRYAIVGTKVRDSYVYLVVTTPTGHTHLQCGHLQLLELSSNCVIEEIPAHEGAVWAVALSPDNRGMASGSADHTVKFWEFELVSSALPSQEGKR